MSGLVIYVSASERRNGGVPDIPSLFEFSSVGVTLLLHHAPSISINNIEALKQLVD